MSLLEDIFLRDEADEAKELERIIEGDEYDEKPQARSDSDDNSEKEGEAEEEKKRVDPSSTKTKRAVRNPRFLLNPARLTGPRGIQVIPNHFKDFKFKGKGHEKEDLDLVLKKLEHWAYRLYPKFEFGDCLKKIETLGKKRPVMVHLQKIRSDQYTLEETVVQKDSSDDEAAPVEKEEDEFDKLLQQQIELARSTPGPGSVKKAITENSVVNRSLFTAPNATSSPSISEDQRERMMRSRKLAEERRLARLKNATLNKDNLDTESTNSSTNDDSNNVQNPLRNQDNEFTIDTEKISMTKKNRSNIIDSSDEEDGLMCVNESITVDIHAVGNKNYPTMKTNEENGEIDDLDICNDIVRNNVDIRTQVIEKIGTESDVLQNLCNDDQHTKQSKEHEYNSNKIDDMVTGTANVVNELTSAREIIVGEENSNVNTKEVDILKLVEEVITGQETELTNVNKVVTPTQDLVKPDEMEHLINTKGKPRPEFEESIDEEIKTNEAKVDDADFMDVDFIEDF